MSFLLFALVLRVQPPGAPSIEPAEKAHAQALALLDSGDAPGAEAAVRRALDGSSRFVPEIEMATAPEKRLLFEDAIAAARDTYRSRRARYFETLGRALEGQKRFVEARKAFGRSVGLEPSAAVQLRMASQPDFDPAERIRLLTDAFFAPDGGPKVVDALLDTGGFRRREDLEALLDVERFRRKLGGRLASVRPRLALLPDFRVLTDAGTLVASDVFSNGQALVMYFPAAGCNRCGEELDGIGRAVADELRSERKLSAAVFVGEKDLDSTRRILRTLAMRIQVGRIDRLPAPWRPQGPAVAVVGRRGRVHFERDLAPEPRSAEIRRDLSELFELVNQENVPPGTDAVDAKVAAVTTRQGELGALFSYVELARGIEAGPLPLAQLGDRMDQLVLQIVAKASAREELYEMLTRFSTLAGAGRSKASLLSALDGELPRKLLAAAQALDASIEREASRDEGCYRVATGAARGKREILLQRSFLQSKALRHFNFILSERGDALEVTWAGVESGEPKGVRLSAAGAWFLFEKDGRGGLRLASDSGAVYEGVPARIEKESGVVEEVAALVDPVPGGGPAAWRRGAASDKGVVFTPTRLDQGLAAFRQGKYKEALAAFEAAAKAIDPEAPYDEIDVRYNVARVHQELGDRKKAMDLLRSIGDAPYQALVDEKLRALETGAVR